MIAITINPICAEELEFKMIYEHIWISLKNQPYKIKFLRSTTQVNFCLNRTFPINLSTCLKPNQDLRSGLITISFKIQAKYKHKQQKYKELKEIKDKRKKNIKI